MSVSESEATKRAVAASRAGWISDLRELLRDAQRRFSDVAWRIDGDSEHIYGHKAILYARANAAFQAKYLNPNGNARLQAIMSGSNLSIHNQSPLLGVVATSPPHSHPASRAVSPGAGSFDSTVSASGQQSPILVGGTEAAFFRALLDFLYTGSTSMREAFTFLFEDASFVLNEREALDRLSQDLLFAWRSKLFADVQIQITDLLGDIPDEDMSDTATLAEQEYLVAAHRSILSARCPYFSTIFLSPYLDSNAEEYTLPSPPFTPAALHFTLAYIYSGSLQLSRSFDLSTAMQIWRAATYLSMDLMKAEVECRMSDMCHNFKGCCRTCRQRSTRLFSFAVEPDVNCDSLRIPIKRVILAHFGETWGKEVGELPYEVQKDLIVDLCQSTTSADVVSASKGISAARKRLLSERAAWADHVRSMLSPLEERLQHFLRADFVGVATSRSFIDLVDGIGFSNDALEGILKSMAECQTEQTAAKSYETLVGKVLLREEGITMDARARVEETQKVLLAYIKKRWMNIRSAGGFDKLENWCLKELSDELAISVDDLLRSRSSTELRPLTKTGLRLTQTKVHKVEAEDMASTPSAGPSSLRASVLNRNAARKSTASSVSVTSASTYHKVDARQRLGSAGPAALRARTPSATGPRTFNVSPTTTPPLPTAGDVAVSESPNTMPSKTLRPRSIRSVSSASSAKRAAPEVGGTDKSAPSYASSTSAQQDSASLTMLSEFARAEAARPGTLRTRVASTPGSINSLRSAAPVGASGVASGSRTRTASGSSALSTVSTAKSIKRPPTKPAATPVSVKRPSSVASIRSTKGTVSQQAGKTPTGSPSMLKSPASVSKSRSTTAVPPVPSLPISRPVTPKAEAVKGTLPKLPGSRLKQGIPCVVTLRHTKFRATVRYLGEVKFGQGSFVGVEVPVTAETSGLKLDWNNGSVDGVEYFLLGQSVPARSSVKMAKVKEAAMQESPGPSKGLFVRPSEVLYVF